jgi:hypothetical protein
VLRNPQGVKDIDVTVTVRISTRCWDENGATLRRDRRRQQEAQHSHTRSADCDVPTFDAAKYFR